MWGCFLMSGVKILHFLKDWWKSIPIHQNYTMALNLWNRKLGEQRTSDEDSHSWLLFVLEYVSARSAKAR